MSASFSRPVGNGLDVELIAKQIPGFHCAWSLFDGAVLAFACGRPTNYVDIDDNPEIQKIIGGVAVACGFRKIYLPSVRNANAVVLTENQLPTVEIQRWNGVEVHVGGEVDGVRLLSPGSAMIIQSADCPTCIARLPNETVVGMHSGLRSLEQWGDLEAHDPTRQYESVLEAGLAGFDPGSHSVTRAALLCGIGPKHFRYPRNHERYGPSNTQLLAQLSKKYGAKVVTGVDEDEINLQGIVLEQLNALGVPVQDDGVFFTDGICTFSDSVAGDVDEPLWHSHVRYYRDGGVDGRNLILLGRPG